MNTTRPMTKSPRAVAREALRLARESLPAYSSRFSRKDYTQHQLFALLALKTFFKTDYRGLARMLADFAQLRSALGPDAVPHSSTLCYAAGRLLKRGGRCPPLPGDRARPGRRPDRRRADGGRGRHRPGEPAYLPLLLQARQPQARRPAVDQ